MGGMLRRLGLLALVAMALAAGGLVFALRGSLADLDGQAAVPGLAAPASIERDAEGVATITAANPLDAARAQGYVHAQERYFEMDLLRRSAAGELAALFGPVALARDREVRVHRMRSRMVEAHARLTQEDQDLLAAYVDGVEAGRAALTTRPWAYLFLRTSPEPWRPEDSLLVAAAIAFDLQDENNRRELALYRLDRHLGADLMALLAADGSEWDAPLQGEPRVPASLPAPPSGIVSTTTEMALDDAEPARDGPAAEGEGPLPGSNSFAVAAALTADGRALLANDMHLGLRAPNVWFRARLRYADPRAPDGQVDVSGVGLPGVPGIVAGSNGRVAWGFTNSYGDWLDWVRVPWIDRSAGSYQGEVGAEQVKLIEERIAVAGADDDRLMVRETRWGPILQESPDGEALALSWSMHRPGGIDLALLDMALAGDLESALAVGQRAGMPVQNLLVADAGGRIAWTTAGRLPQRLGDCDPLRPLEPLRGCGWAEGWVQPGASPSLVDPEDGRLWTANSRVADGEDLRLIGDGGYDLGARQKQIRDRLRASEHFDERALLAIQLDAQAVFLERWWHLLREVVVSADAPALQRLAAASAHWEGEARADAVGYRLAREFRTRVLRRLSDAVLAKAKATEGERWVPPRLNQFEALAWRLLEERPPGWLDEGTDGWDGLLRAVADELVVDLEATGPLQERRWGELNRARICHPLAGGLPAPVSTWLCMPGDELPGDAHLPRVQAPAFGASQRMVVSPGREAEGFLHAPAGQSGHPLSPFWMAGHQAWVDGAASPFLPGPAVHRLILIAP